MQWMVSPSACVMGAGGQQRVTSLAAGTRAVPGYARAAVVRCGL